MFSHMKWREFQSCGRNKRVKTWRVAQDGEWYVIEHGLLGGKMQTTRDRPGPKGREGTASHMTAEENCAFNIERLVRRKTEKGYVELSDDGVVPAATAQWNASLDFSKKLPKQFCPYKPIPERGLSVDELKTLCDEDRAIFTRKRDGECHLLVHHDDGWRIYSRRM